MVIGRINAATAVHGGYRQRAGGQQVRGRHNVLYAIPELAVPISEYGPTSLAAIGNSEMGHS